jgi:hypothetical protein
MIKNRKIVYLKNSTNDEDECLYSDYYEQASILYYKIIETILINEKKRLNDQTILIVSFYLFLFKEN